MTQVTQHTPRKILVTGCASGIGLAQTQLFLDGGDQVYGVDKQKPQAIDDPNFSFFQVDLVGDLTALLAQLPQNFDVICHTAGGGGAAYTTSKHALAGFTKQLALDYARTRVQIFGIAPGAVQTGMTRQDFEADNGQMADWVASETPVGRWAQPSEVAELTAFLASGKASYMQGEIVKIDGGWTLK